LERFDARKTVAENEILRRRSQAWWTFMRNHAMTTVQSRNGHSWARDVLSPLRSRSRAFRYHLSAKLPVRHFGPFGIRFIHYLLRDAALGPDVVPHVLRHTAITWTAQRGILKHEICGFFGITEDV